MEGLQQKEDAGIMETRKCQTRALQASYQGDVAQPEHPAGNSSHDEPHRQIQAHTCISSTVSSEILGDPGYPLNPDSLLQRCWDKMGALIPKDKQRSIPKMPLPVSKVITCKHSIHS